MAELQPWQQEIVDRLPSTAVVTFGEEGGQFKAAIGPWSLDRGWGGHWVNIKGPCIYPTILGRIAIAGPNATTRALDVLAALGLPMR